MPSPAGGECRSPPSRSSRQDQDSASESSSVQSGEVPERRDIDILAQVLSTRSEEYRLLFRLPHDEVLVQDFNCALQENILLQGHMYLFLHHICFYSNIFGFETKRTISYYEVTCVRKAKTAAIFPTAIEIMTGEKRHFFGSFLSRDEAYKIIMEGWQQHSNDPGALMDGLESKSETRSLESTAVTLDPESCSPPQANGSTCGGSVVINNLEILENEKANGGASSEDGWPWQPEEADAPRVPDYFTMVAEGKFPVHVEEFFKLFFSDAAVDFLQNFHTTCGDKDFHCSRWHRNAEFVHTRDLSFRHPIKIYFGAKLGHCHTIQKFRVYRNSHLVIEASQQVSDIPYGDYFHVQVLWDVEEDVNETNGCSLRVYINLAFSRKTMWKGKIEQNTIEECQEVYENWIRNAHELLKEKNLEEHLGVYLSVTNITQGHDVELESSVKPHHSKELPPSPHASIPKMPHAAKPKMLLPPPEHFTSFAEGPKFINPIITFVKGSWTNLASYTRSMDHGSLSLIAAAVIIFMLIQLSGILLLTRTTEVRVISHDYHMNSLTHDRTEIIDWLDKRVQLLNEEMSMMEIRMERLKREYSFLKGQLQDLRQFKQQQ